MKTTLHLPGQVRALLASENPTRLTLSDVRLAARQTGAAQIIAHASDPSRVIIVMPGGAVFGTSQTKFGWMEAEEIAGRYGTYQVRAGEVLA